MLGVVTEVGLPLAGIEEPGEEGFLHEDGIARSGLGFALMAFTVMLALYLEELIRGRGTKQLGPWLG